MKKILLYSIPIISVSTICISISCKNEVNNDIVMPDLFPELPNPGSPEIPEPDKPEVPEPDKPEVPEPDKPEVPEPDKPEVPEPDKPAEPSRVEFYYKNDQELLNLVNSLYKDTLKSEIIELAKIDIVDYDFVSIVGASSIDECNIIVQETLTLNNVSFVNIENNVYKLNGIKDLNVQISSKKSDQSMDIQLSFLNNKWEIYFIKQ